MERHYQYIQEQNISLNNLFFKNSNVINSIFKYDFVLFLFYSFLFVRRIHKIAKSDYWASSCLSVRPTVRLSVCLSACPSAWNNSAPTRLIFMKFDISGGFFSKSVDKIEV